MNCVVLVFTIFTSMTLVNTLPMNQTYESPTTTATPTSTTLEVLNHGVDEAKTTKVIPLQVPLDSYTGSVSDSGNIITRSGLFGLRETLTFPSSFSRPLSYLDSENIIGRTALLESRFAPISYPGQSFSPEYDDEDSDENETTQSSDKQHLTDSSGSPAYSSSKKIMTKEKHQNLRVRPTNHSGKNITLGNIDDDSQGKKVIETSLEKPPTTTVSPLKRYSASPVSEKLRSTTPTPSQMSKVLPPLSPTSTSVKQNSTSLVSEKLGSPTATPSQMSKVLSPLSPTSTSVPPLKGNSASLVSEKLRSTTPTPSQMSKVLPPLSPTSTSVKQNSTSLVSEKLGSSTATPSQMSKVLSPLSPTSTSVPPLKGNSASLVSEKLRSTTPTPSQMSKVLPPLSPTSTSVKQNSTSLVSEKLGSPTATPSQMSKVLSPLSPTSMSVPPLKLNSTSLVSEKLGSSTATPSQMSKVLPPLSPRSTTVPPLPSGIFTGTLGNCNPLIAVSLKHGLRTMGVIFISIKNSISVNGLPLLVL